MNVAWVVLHRQRRIGASERRQLIPHVCFQVPFLGPESRLKSGFACGGLLCFKSMIASKNVDVIFGLLQYKLKTGWSKNLLRERCEKVKY